MVFNLLAGNWIEIESNFAKVAIVLFMVVDPIGDIPLFVVLTGKMTEGEK